MTGDLKGSPRTFAYADVGYFGLTHSLLAWARCHLWSIDHNVPMIAPSWLRVKGRVGPWLRREKDKRQYQSLFRFPDYICGVRRLRLLALCPKVDAERLVGNERHDDLDGSVIVFRNKEGKNTETYFKYLLGREVSVLEGLTRMTRPRLIPEIAKQRNLAVHVRMGDFATAIPKSEILGGRTNSRLPLQWYVDMVRGLHAMLGAVPTVLYSDGKDEELKPLLELPGVRRSSPSTTAITDLLAMAQAAALVSSGSGYSLWGAYLGSVPRVCFPGQRIVRTRGGWEECELEPECNSTGELSSGFIDHVAKRLATPIER